MKTAPALLPKNKYSHVSLLIYAQLHHAVEQQSEHIHPGSKQHKSKSAMAGPRQDTETETKGPFKSALSINRAFPVRRGYIPPSWG